MGKKKRIVKLRLWVKVVLAIIITLIVIYSIKGHFKGHIDTINVEVVEIGGEEPKEEEEPFKEVIEVVEEVQAPEVVEEPNSYTTRMTSYYPEEGETTTASGLEIYNFGVNQNGWFTYNGKLVVATASRRLGVTNMRTFNLYDELTLNIDGIDYDAIVLDVCGACQRDNRIDLFASSYIYAKDTQITVKTK